MKLDFMKFLFNASRPLRRRASRSGDDWAKTCTLTGKPDLQVETSDANIHVSTGDQSALETRETTTSSKTGRHAIRIEDHHDNPLVIHTGDGSILAES